MRPSVWYCRGHGKRAGTSARSRAAVAAAAAAAGSQQSAARGVGGQQWWRCSSAPRRPVGRPRQRRGCPGSRAEEGGARTVYLPFPWLPKVTVGLAVRGEPAGRRKRLRRAISKEAGDSGQAPAGYLAWFRQAEGCWIAAIGPERNRPPPQYCRRCRSGRARRAPSRVQLTSSSQLMVHLTGQQAFTFQCFRRPRPPLAFRQVPPPAT